MNILLLLNKVCKGWTAEYKFHPSRKWRFDFCHPERMIAVEIEGGIFARSRLGHTTGIGFKRNMEKYNAATLLGYMVLRYMPEQTGQMMDDVKQITSNQKEKER